MPVPFNQNEIVIARVYNGWLVTLPTSPNKTMEGFDMAGMAQKIMGAVMSDEGAQPVETPAPPQMADQVSITPDENTFFFQKLSELLGFLKIKIEE